MAVNCYERFYPITNAKESDNPFDAEPNVLSVSIAYSKGGVNYFSYRQEERGFWLHIQPERRSGHTVTCSPMDGVKTCVEQVSRFSAKAFNNCVADIDKYVKDYVRPYCEQNGIKISDTFSENYRERHVA